MARTARTGLQIRFNGESEQDLIDFFSRLKKAEVHITAISAFRMYMRSIGFYEGRRRQNHRLPGVLPAERRSQAQFKDRETVDEEALSTLNRLFDTENNL